MMKQTWRAAFPIDDLEPHPDNPNRGDVDTIAESIDAHGFYGAVMVQESRKRIIAGEHRWRAARQEGMTKLPVILVDCDDEEALRIMLVDNRSAEKSQRDDQILATILNGMTDLTGTGYDDDDMKRLARILAVSESEWTADGAWEGMPEYTSENRIAKFKVSVYFTDKADVAEFFQRIDREITTRLWWPKPEDDAPGESWQYKVIVDDD